MTILTSNREIIKEIQEEKEKNGSGDDGGRSDNSKDQKPMET